MALYESGVDPVVLGLAAGLVAWANPAGRTELERASQLFRDFREQPTPELERSARSGLREAVSPNARLIQLYHPWTSYVIVPLFALANIGIAIDGDFLSSAYASPITLGILVGYVLGKPVGIAGVSWLVTKLSRGRLRPPVGWAATIGGGAIAGIGFTVSILIAALAFNGTELREAKLGVLSAAILASTLTWLVFRGTAMLPRQARIRALLGGSEVLTDLAVPVDPERDHVRGPAEAPVTLVEYGDFECPYCGRAEAIIRELLADFGDVRYVWRNLPLSDVHPGADLAAEAAEAAAAQGEFWKMHDLLLEHQGKLKFRQLRGYADAARPRPRPLRRRAARERACAADRGRRRLRRPQRRHRHADLLHQRETPRGRLRHRHPLGRGAGGAGAGADQRLSVIAISGASGAKWRSRPLAGDRDRFAGRSARGQGAAQRSARGLISA